MILIIDHGQGNIGSLRNTLDNLEIKNTIINSEQTTIDYNLIGGFILPGVGTFNSGMKEMRKRGLDNLVYKLRDKGVKGMGICLGMQMLCEKSAEDNYIEDGLGIFPGTFEKLSKTSDKVPNIGWNITTSKASNTTNNSLESFLNETFYYVHSYGHKKVEDPNVISTFNHGKEKIAAALYGDNILGVQFHPEKSQGAGLALLNEYFNGDK